MAKTVTQKAIREIPASFNQVSGVSPAKDCISIGVRIDGEQFDTLCDGETPEAVLGRMLRGTRLNVSLRFDPNDGSEGDGEKFEAMQDDFLTFSGVGESRGVRMTAEAYSFSIKFPYAGTDRETLERAANCNGKLTLERVGTLPRQQPAADPEAVETEEVEV